MSSMAESSVKLWEDSFDECDEAAAELFIVTLLREARAAEDDGEEDEEQKQRHARVFEPWQPTLLGSALQPSVAAAAKRTVVMGLRAPPHLGRSVKPAKKPRAA